VASEKQSERPKRTEVREVSRAETIARKLAKVAPEEDPAHVAGAIAIFATETIKRSANNLMEARAYLDGLKNGIDGLLKNAFADEVEKRQEDDAAKKDKN
jgi:stage V sporulation protein SpoVS